MSFSSVATVPKAVRVCVEAHRTGTTAESTKVLLMDTMHAPFARDVGWDEQLGPVWTTMRVYGGATDRPTPVDMVRNAGGIPDIYPNKRCDVVLSPRPKRTPPPR